MKQFDIPVYYRSSFIQKVKEFRKEKDHYKKDFSPTILDFGPLKIYLARHFGFCYGVENAIDIAYRTLEENPGKKIFLLSEMIHNPDVNNDLRDRGIEFIMDSEGNKYIEWDKVSSEDIVIIPAFGTTMETEALLKEKGIDTVKYNTTCPFVEKVWNRSESLGKKDYTVVIHGKAKHEETRATFSHANQNTPSLIIRDIEETKILSQIILGNINKEEFYSIFKDKYSPGFDAEKNLMRIGVVNQTTMLASETQEIADYLKQTMTEKYGLEKTNEHFADTKDTLCYATNDNQQATIGLLDINADIAIVVGGYNSSNTSHIVELLEPEFNTYFISGCDKIISKNQVKHFDINSKSEIESKIFLPEKNPAGIVITSGASCPDSTVEQIIDKVLSFYNTKENKEEVLKKLLSNN